jgi:YegS/Rv2252/BmrU family lipid kinase
VLLVANPRARSGAAAGTLVEPLRSLGLEVRLEQPAGIERLHAVIREFGPMVDRIVVAGGDGTLAAALPALLEVDRPLAVIPLGTANDFARNLRLPARREAQLALVAEGTVRRVDLGSVNGRPFLNAVSIGLGAAVASLHQGDAKRWLGVLNYPRVLYLAWRRIHPFGVEIICDGVVHRSHFVHVAALNGRFHGGGIEPRPEGSVSDGVFDLYALRDGPAFRLMRILAALKLEGVETGAVFRLVGHRLTIRTARPRRANVDGELGLMTPLELAVMPKALAVVVPEARHGGPAAVDRQAATP